MDPATYSYTTPHHLPPTPQLAAWPSSQPSPSRRQHFPDNRSNPLLSNLSPSSTLEAIQASHLIQSSDNSAKSFVQESVASASTSERSWGIKAALAGKRVQDWYEEVGAWTWPGFDQPPLEEPTRGRTRHRQIHPDNALSREAMQSGGGNVPGKSTAAPLSPKLVQTYEERIATIRRDMEALEIEDLKDYVRYTHYKAASRRPSLRDPQAISRLATDYDHLNDFTAIITATIVQALPTISRLETLLNTWSTRLLVLRQVPSFLVDLDSGRESMVSASIAIGAYDGHDPKRRMDFSWKAFSDIRAVLQDQITELGRKLDRMLDLLEGSVDTLPNAWIDDLDNMENQYSAWVVKAEKLAMNKELRIERLERDYTQYRKDELLDLDGLLDNRRTTLSLTSHEQSNGIKRLADSDFDLTRQTTMESPMTENAVTDSSTQTSTRSFDLEPFPPKNALAEQSLAQFSASQAPTLDNNDDRSLNESPSEPKTPPPPIRPNRRLTPLVLAELRESVRRMDSPDVASDTSDSGSSASDYSSNKSSPKIQSAVVAEYIGTPIRVKSPTLLGREPMTSAEIAFRRLGPPAGAEGPETDHNDVLSDFVSVNERRNGGPWHVRTRSDSFRSLEATPKHEIRRIQVQRKGSHSSALSLSEPEYGQVQPSRLPPLFNLHRGNSEPFRITAPLPAPSEVKNSQSTAPTQKPNLRLDTPKRHPLYHPPPPVSVRSSTSVQSSDAEFNPSRQQLPYHSPPPVSPGPSHSTQSLSQGLDIAEHQLPYHSPPSVAPKSTHRFEQVSDLGPGSMPAKIGSTQRNDAIGGHSGDFGTPQHTKGSATKNFDDQLEERISSILTELPTQIRLTSGPEPDAPEVTRFGAPSITRTPKVRLPAWRSKKRQISNPLPSMTLAPAQPKSSQTQSPTTEPNIKLYHLHQAGKTAPIKLFVRLVGEGGERVMVRIGGGWADLGEYLREYAGHHGRRSVSDNPFDFSELPSSSPLTNNQTPRSRPGSRPISPTSSSSKHTPFNRLARQQTSQATVNEPHTPHSDLSMRNSPRLSWAGTDDASPSLGLAGPKTKNVDISPRKQAWVDEMMEKARLGGAEKRGGGGGGSNESVVGDLGKVGKTRRVFFRKK